jgi:hypothetical protein
MATVSLIESENLQKYELALRRLGASKSSRRQTPIVEGGNPAFSEQDAVSAAAKALAALWNRGQGSGRRSR